MLLLKTQRHSTLIGGRNVRLSNLLTSSCYQFPHIAPPPSEMWAWVLQRSQYPVNTGCWALLVSTDQMIDRVNLSAAQRSRREFSSWQHPAMGRWARFAVSGVRPTCYFCFKLSRSDKSCVFLFLSFYTRWTFSSLTYWQVFAVPLSRCMLHSLQVFKF